MVFCRCDEERVEAKDRVSQPGNDFRGNLIIRVRWIYSCLGRISI